MTEIDAMIAEIPLLWRLVPAIVVGCVLAALVLYEARWTR